MKIILFDTSFLIALQRSDMSAANFLKKISTDVAISIVTKIEVEIGDLYLRKYSKKGNKLLPIDWTGFKIFEINHEIAEKTAEIQSDLMLQGKLLGDFDSIIAATAIVSRMTLVTLDRDFSRVDGLNVELVV